MKAMEKLKQWRAEILSEIKALVESSDKIYEEQTNCKKVILMSECPDGMYSGYEGSEEVIMLRKVELGHRGEIDFYAYGQFQDPRKFWGHYIYPSSIPIEDLCLFLDIMKSECQQQQ